MSHGKGPEVAKVEAVEKKLYSGWNTGAHAQTSGIHRGMETKANTRAGVLTLERANGCRIGMVSNVLNVRCPGQHDIGLESSLSL